MVRSCLASGDAKRQVTAGTLLLPEAQNRRVSSVTRSRQGGRRVGDGRDDGSRDLEHAPFKLGADWDDESHSQGTPLRR
jgi:hypothetical protein